MGYLLVSDAMSLHFAAGITYTAWIFAMGQPTYRGVLAKRVNDGVDVVFTAFLGAGLITADLPGTRFTSTGSIIPNQWNHIAVTYDAVQGEGAIYINGSFQGNSMADMNFGVQTADLFIGLLPMGTAIDPNAFFIGSIDEVAIWNRPLSGSDIGKLAMATEEL
jgi:hypothetical protein